GLPPGPGGRCPDPAPARLPSAPRGQPRVALRLRHISPDLTDAVAEGFAIPRGRMDGRFRLQSALVDPREDQKRAAAEAPALLVEDGMAVGLGTGTTVAHFLPALAARALRDLRCVATSEATTVAAKGLGLSVQAFDLPDHLDLAVDGADQVAPDLWL